MVHKLLNLSGLSDLPFSPDLFIEPAQGLAHDVYPESSDTSGISSYGGKVRGGNRPGEESLVVLIGGVEIVLDVELGLCVRYKGIRRVVVLEGGKRASGYSSRHGWKYLGDRAGLKVRHLDLFPVRACDCGGDEVAEVPRSKGAVYQGWIGQDARWVTWPLLVDLSPILHRVPRYARIPGAVVQEGKIRVGVLAHRLALIWKKYLFMRQPVRYGTYESLLPGCLP